MSSKKMTALYAWVLLAVIESLDVMMVYCELICGVQISLVNNCLWLDRRG